MTLSVISFLYSGQMEAMEVDSTVVPEAGNGVQPEVAAVREAEDVDAPHAISDSGSSTEVDEDEENGAEDQQTVQAPLRLPATWAFSQRAVDEATAVPSATQLVAMRRSLRWLTLQAFFSKLFSLCPKHLWSVELVCSTDRVSGFIIPARLLHLPEDSRISCSEHQLPVQLSQSQAALLRPVSLRVRRTG